MVVNFYL